MLLITHQSSPLKKVFLYFILLGGLLFSCGTQNPAKAQCAECGTPRTYTSSNTSLDDKTNSNGGLNSTKWNGGSTNFTQGQIPKFSGNNVSYTWTATDFNLGGIILSNGADLTLDRDNNGDEPGFTISDGCIVVGSGSILRLVYITELSNLRICVEDGGSIVFDQKDIPQDRNDFNFDNVIIDLQGPNATLSFGDADINIGSGGLVIDGWTGEGSDLCENGNPPIPGSSGNISWTSEIQLNSLCEVLNGVVLPLEWAYLQTQLIKEARKVNVEWATYNAKNTTQFQIERSVGGISEWIKIGDITPSTIEDDFNAYQFSDNYLPLSGTYIYYRIKSIDSNEGYSYSELSRVELPKAQASHKKWHVYPNPTFGGEFKIQPIETDFSKLGEVKVRLIGKYTKDIFYSTKSLEELNAKLSSEIQQSSPGVILLEIQSKEGVDVIKIIRK